MTNIRSLFTASILAASIGVAQAQTPPVAAADPHHPATGTAAAAPVAPPQGGMAMGAPGAQGMSGMMGGDMGKMMQSMMPMMRMMMMRGGMEQVDGPMGMMGMMAPQRIEGLIAFLTTELKITDAQVPQWNAFADVLRKNAKGMVEMRAAMMQTPTQTSAPASASAPDRADQHIKMMTAGLEAAKASAAAMRALYAVLADAQKATADELLVPPMGRM